MNGLLGVQLADEPLGAVVLVLEGHLEVELLHVDVAVHGPLAVVGLHGQFKSFF